MSSEFISLRDFPGASPLLTEYAEYFPKLAKWYHYNPFEKSAVSARLGELDARDDTGSWKLRGESAEAAANSLKNWGADEQAIENAQSLAQHGTFAVVTGQQTGLFGGPLYTQLKAISTIISAEKLAEQFPQRRFVPVFWMASSDSDFEEVRSTTVLDRHSMATNIELPAGDPGDNTIMRARDLSADMPAALDALEEQLAGGEHREEVIAVLRECYSDGNMVDGFSRWMLRLFRGTGLVVIDPQDAAYMRTAGKLIKRELESTEAAAKVEQKLVARNKEISSAGWNLQVGLTEGDTSFFLLDESNVRHKITRSSDGFALQPSGKAISAEELLKIADETPERFVCSVMSRPVYQNRPFPVAGWIGGGAEIAYRAQVTSVFDFHGEKMAPAYLRNTATLLPAKLLEMMREMEWSLLDCFRPVQDLKAEAANRERPEKIEAAIERYRSVLESSDEELKKLAVELDPNLEASFDTLRGNLEKHVDKLEKKITGVLKQRSDVLMRRIDQLASCTYPGQGLQERSLNMLSWLPRYGFEMTSMLIDKLHFPCWQHQIVDLD